MNAERHDLLAKLRIERDGPKEVAADRQPRKFLFWGALFGVAVILLVLGVLIGRFSAPTVPSQESAGNADITVAEVPQPVLTKPPAASAEAAVLDASGYVVARRVATVSAKATGKVVAILVEEGMAVEEGQLLARMDAQSAATELNLVQSQVAAARASLRETQARLAEAKLSLQRVKNLVKQNLVSVAEQDKAEASANSLSAAVDTRRAQLDTVERQRELAQQRLDDSYIRAPFPGVVTQKNAQPGEMVSPVSAGGGFTRTGICTLVDMQSLEVEVDVNEAYINRVYPGQRVDARLDAYPDWAIPAKVAAIVPTANRQRATIKVRIEFDRLDPRILPEMGIKVSFFSGL